MKTLISAAVAAIGLAVTAPASAVVVGGIDFGALGGPPARIHLESGDLAETFADTIGQTIEGYGAIAKVNGDATYCAGNNANCTLYYHFYNYKITNFSAGAPGFVSFSGGVVDIYKSNAPVINFLNQNSTANVAFITGLAPWLELTGHTFVDPSFPLAFNPATLNGKGSLTGATLDEKGAGLLDVVYGWGDPSVAGFLDTNSIFDNIAGFADVAIGAEGNNNVLNPFDQASALADTCQSTPAYQQWCFQGTISTRGKTPEPGTIALLGLGLFGAAFSQRRRKLPV